MNSYIVLSAAKATEMAKAAMTWYQQQALDLVGHTVSYETKRINNLWYRRLFRMKAFTEADVRRLLENEREPYGVPSRLDRARTYYSAEIDLAQSVFRAASSGEPLHLSLEDFETLSV